MRKSVTSIDITSVQYLPSVIFSKFHLDLKVNRDVHVPRTYEYLPRCNTGTKRRYH